jgi:hypothetical protein
VNPLAMLAACAVPVFFLGACGSKEAEPTNTQPTPGTATLSFSVKKSVRDNPKLVDPLAGLVYGSLFLTEDVTLAGPIKGAPEQAGVKIDIDVTKDEVSKVVWKSPPLAPQRYTFLGMFDVDKNGSMTLSPDSGDPVVLPTTNRFDVKSGEETKFTVVFDLLYN